MFRSNCLTRICSVTSDKIAWISIKLHQKCPCTVIWMNRWTVQKLLLHHHEESSHKNLTSPEPVVLEIIYLAPHSKRSKNKFLIRNRTSEMTFCFSLTFMDSVRSSGSDRVRVYAGKGLIGNKKEDTHIHTPQWRTFSMHKLSSALVWFLVSLPVRPAPCFTCAQLPLPSLFI